MCGTATGTQQRGASDPHLRQIEIDIDIEIDWDFDWER